MNDKQSKLHDMKRMILLATAFLATTGMYAAQTDSLTVTNTVQIEAPNRVTLTQSDNQLTIDIEGEKGNPEFRYTRQVNISSSEPVVTKERNSNWDFNIPFRKQKKSSRYKQNEFVIKDFKLGLSKVMNAPAPVDANMASSWEITTPSLGWAYYPWHSNTSFSIGLACSWRNYRMTGKNRFIKEGSEIVLGSYPEGADIEFSRIKVFSWSVPLMFSHEFENKLGFSLGAIVNFNTHASLKTRYNLGDEKVKLTDNNIHQTPVTVDFQASISCKAVGIYVKYSPCNILDTSYGPKFSALSAGIILF